MKRSLSALLLASLGLASMLAVGSPPARAQSQSPGAVVAPDVVVRPAAPGVLVVEPGTDAAAGRENAVLRNEMTRQHLQALVAEVERHLRLRADGTLALNPRTLQANPLSPEAQQFAAVSLARTNALVRSGVVHVDAQFRLHPGSARARFQPMANEQGFQWYWWGFRVALNDGTAQYVAMLVEGGAWIGAIAAAIPGPQQVAGAVAAALLGFEGWLIRYYDWQHHGIYVYCTIWGSWLASQPA